VKREELGIRNATKAGNIAAQQIRQGFVYQPLPSVDSFRLIKLHAGVRGDELSGEIVLAHLGAHPPYSALSYAWKNHNEEVPFIMNRQTLHIRRNLANALEEIRGSVTQYIWVDAICIDQHNYLERNMQVAKMGDIYRDASSTIVWLHGEEESNVQRLLGQSETPLHGHNHWLWPDIMAKAWGAPPASRSLRAKYSDNMPRLSQEDFAEDRLRLQNLFWMCEEEEFAMLSIALSATLTSFRPLLLPEIARVAALSMRVDPSLQGTTDDLTRFLLIQGICQDAKTQILGEMLRNKWDKVLCVDQQGFVTFARKSMGSFFSTFPIRGINTTHGIMANACLRELELSTVLSEMEHITDFNACHVPCTVSDLSLYAAEHWGTHYSLAQDSNPALSERLHKLLWVQLRNAHHPSAPDQNYSRAPFSFLCNDCTQYAFSYCQDRGFVVLENAYAQMRVMSQVIDTARGGLKSEHDVRELGKTLSLSHIAATTDQGPGCSNLLSSPTLRPCRSWHTNWDSDGTDSTATDSEWLFVEQRK